MTKAVATTFLSLNFCMYSIVLAIGGWATNKAINEGFFIGSGFDLPEQFSPICYSMGNAATGFFVVFSLIASVFGVASLIVGIDHIRHWNSDGSSAMPSAVSAATVAWSLTALAMGKVELKTEEFVLGNVIDAVVTQAMIPLEEKNLKLLHDVPDRIRSLTLYGDQIKLQLVLSDFLLSVVNHSPSLDGWVEIRVVPGLKLMQDGNAFICVQFR
ncbi:unnamed protein product [Cuscuta campestris]|uniref:Uncharacterized protein n=1 Tax=Cuscuta campestris TaxID=132261 RepID=A0A484K6X4_9ASTE|nr:unnamed protein product [Cuscuta campestris]